MITRIVVHQHPNKDCLTIHTSVQISESRRESFEFPLRESSKEPLEKLGDAGATLVREVLSQQGVKEVTIYPYELHLRKSPAIKWEEIFDAILMQAKVACATVADVDIEQVEGENPFAPREDEGEQGSVELPPAETLTNVAGRTADSSTDEDESDLRHGLPHH